MGKRSKDRVGKKERRRAEAAALARSTWLTETAGLSTANAPGVAPGADARPNKAARAAVRPISTPGSGAQPDKTPTPDAPPASTAGAPPTAADAPPTAVDATELAARLASLSTNLQRELGRADAGDGLTRARLSALSLLVLGGPRTLGDLAAGEHVRPPTMTRLVHAMEADGLVVREPHPTDGRSIIIRATRSGEELLGQGRAHQIAALARAIGDLDEADRARLADAADLLGQVVRASGREATRGEMGDREMGDRIA
jgi:DNA-binding MarR family transcriptional regulator